MYTIFVSVKVLVPVVLILYLFWRRLPFLVENLARSVTISCVA